MVPVLAGDAREERGATADRLLAGDHALLREETVEDDVKEIEVSV